MSWSSYPIPAVPADMAESFVAHSVTLSTDPSVTFAPCLDWEGFSSYAGPGEDLKTAPADPDRVRLLSSIASLLPQHWGKREGSVILLKHGTAVFVPPGREARFAGFAPKEPKRGPLHRMPVYRFAEKEVDAANSLVQSQRRYESFLREHPECEREVDFAFSMLNGVGYPLPGQETSDANVVALWNRPSRAVGQVQHRDWAAFVECSARSAPELGTIVITSMPASIYPDAPNHMEWFASKGRDQLRLEFLEPEALALLPISASER